MSVSEHTPLPAAESTAEVVAEENYPTHRLGWLEDAEHGIRVPVTEVHQDDSPDGTPNAPLTVYRTMGPGSVPERGLPAQRAEWIRARGDVRIPASVKVVNSTIQPHAKDATSPYKFFELADIEGNARKGKSVHDISPVALEAVARIDAIFDIERGINGLAAVERQEARRQLSRPLVEALHDWLLAERDRMSKHNPVAKAIGYMFKAERWPAFTRFLDDGRVCLTNNAAERSLRGFALGRKAWLFAGSERGADRAAAMATLINTAKLNDVDPQAWLADVLARIADHPASRLNELLPWEWKLLRQADKPADQQAA